MRRTGFTLVCAALFFVADGAPIVAQELPVRAPTLAPGPHGDPRKPAIDAAEKAASGKDAAAAVHHLLAALWHDPLDADLLARVAALEQDPDRRVLFALLAADAGATDKGVARTTPEWKAALEKVPSLAAVVEMRARSAAELAQFAKNVAGKPLKGDGGPLLSRFLRDVARDVVLPQPASWATQGAALNAASSGDSAAIEPVIAALRSALASAVAAQKSEETIRLARCAQGLAAQAAFDDLKGPKPPDLSKLRAAAASALAQAREWKRAKDGAPLTVEQLEAMSFEEQVEFTKTHRDPANPGVAISPTGKYRIETFCGYETLLGAAQTIESHHARLVAWYGKDPFANKQGVVRIVPEACDLEAEGTPFWWAGGFQSGDVTVLRFNASNIAGLGHGLTHELTHRFDGALLPGLPAWLMEGRAVWTGAAYGATTDAEFVKNHASFGAIDQAMRKGYGGLDKLKQLIDGTIEDYRDNYTAGYALWLYLSTWEENGRPVFAPVLPRFLAACGNKRILPLFDNCFCDGKEGRPKDMPAFAKGFDAFVNGFYWLNPQPWVKERYTESTPPEPDPRPVSDVPTWGFARNRSEPFFGQDQWARAGELLLSIGKKSDAAAAFVLAFLVDEWHTPHALELASLLRDPRCPNVEFVLKNESRLRSPERRLESAGRAPFLVSLQQTLEFLLALERAAGEARSAGLPMTAAALVADRERIAARFGLPQLSLQEAPPATLADAPAPFAGVPHSALAAGVEEVELADYDEYRVANLWFETGEGDLHVGREKPRDSTGELDRGAALRHAFVRSREWLPAGRYRLSTRVHFTTTYVSGAIVFGMLRRDRTVNFGFSSGDYLYSIGVTEQQGEQKKMGWSLSGRRDGEYHGQTPGGEVPLDGAGSSFQLEIIVDGSDAVAWIDGKLAGNYHTVDGQPIEGYFGFASSFGAYRVERPTIERLDRAAALGIPDPRVRGFDLAPGGPTAKRTLINRRARGIPVDPSGTVVIYAPPPDEYEGIPEEDFEREKDNIRDASVRNARLLVENFGRLDTDAKLVLLLPASLGQARLDEIDRELPAGVKSRVTVVLHEKRAVTSLEDDGEVSPLDTPHLVFVDSVGVLRCAEAMLIGDRRLPAAIETWINLYRARGATPEERPAR